MKKGIMCICAVWILMASTAMAQPCVECHDKVTPDIVKDWRISVHSTKNVGCADCHGNLHSSAADVAKVTIPTAETCGSCHAERVAQFKKGKHALGWAAMKAMPTFHRQPIEQTQGMKGCGGCHKIGLKSENDIKELKKNGYEYGVASCDSCHTRHTFSAAEARQPQACQTCHTGFDYSQWETYIGSKHGVRALLKQVGAIPAGSSAPTCQTCHMQNGNHEVRNAWGVTFLRTPMPEDKQWAADRVTILQALGSLDPEGKPTPRLEGSKALDIARQTQEAWQKERDKMAKTCTQCHSAKFANGELAKGDQSIREADHLMAEGIRTVAALYKDGILTKPESYAYPFPDLLNFHDSPTPIELKLWNMYNGHRLHAIQGAFHANPDYAFWYGWAEMRKDLTEINAMAQEMRKTQVAKKK